MGEGVDEERSLTNIKHLMQKKVATFEDKAKTFGPIGLSLYWVYTLPDHSGQLKIFHQPGFSGNSHEISLPKSCCRDAASLKTQGFMDTTRTLSTAWKPLVEICWKWALLVKQKDHRSYGQNLVHGEGTSLSRLGPYRFLQWRHLVQTFLRATRPSQYYVGHT